MCQLVRNTGCIANIILCISMLVVFLINIIFSDTTETFPYGYELSIVVSSIAMSYIAGYIFYLASTFKINHDRIKNAKPISTKIVQEIVITTDAFFNAICNGEIPSHDNINEKLKGLTFATTVPNRTYLQLSDNKKFNQKSVIIGDFLYTDLILKIHRTHIDLASFYPILVPDIQVKLFEYLNCNFFQVFNKDNQNVMSSANADLVNFSTVFISLIETKESLVREYEKYYGKLP